MISESQLFAILGDVLKMNYYFEDINIGACTTLKNTKGVTFLSTDLKSGSLYRIYIIEDYDDSQIYSKMLRDDEKLHQIITDFKETTYCDEIANNSFRIFLHKVKENTSLKSYLINNYDDNYKLHTVYCNFVILYNVLLRHRISFVEPNIENIGITANNEIEINNLDYLFSENSDGNVNQQKNINAIWMLMFLRVVTNNPELLIDNKIFAEVKKGPTEQFLKKHIIPFLNDREYGLLFSIVRCKQLNKDINLEMDVPNIVNTRISKNDWDSAKKIGDGWFSDDLSRFYGIRNPHKGSSDYSEKLFGIVGGCLGLEGDETTTICDGALSNINNYDDIRLSENIATIGADVFKNAKRIKRINFPKSLTSICGNPFKGVVVEELNNISPYFVATSNALYSNGQHRLISYYGEKTVFRVPRPTMIIGDAAFKNNHSIYEIHVDDSVIEVGNSAFEYCINLRKISLPDTITRIGRKAFYLLPSQYIKYINKGNKELEPSLKELTIPSSVTEIGRAAFNGIKKIECNSPKFKTKDGALLSEDGSDLIYYFGNDTFYKIPSGVKTIWESAFKDNNIIEEVFIPDSVQVIESHAFEDCIKLERAILDCSYLFLGESAFSGCTNLISIRMPRNMGVIKNKTFWNCESLLEIDIPNSVEIIEDLAFSNCCSMGKVMLPSSIRIIGEQAFCECKSLKQINFPEGLEQICFGAFEKCDSLSKMVFPNSLEEVDRWAFSNCSLQECHVLSEKTIIDNSTFEYGNDDILLFIPKGADPSKYADIIPQGVRGYSSGVDGYDLPYVGPKTENIVPCIDDWDINDLLDASGGYAHFGSNGGEYSDGMQRLTGIDIKNVDNKKRFIVSPRTKYICNNVFNCSYHINYQGDAHGKTFSCSSNVPFEEIILSNSVEAIGNCSFANSLIKTITLPDSLQYIGDYAFMDCSNLSSITIPKNVNHIGINPFYESGNCYYSGQIKEIVSLTPNYVIESSCILSSDMENLISCFYVNVNDSNEEEKNVQSPDEFVFRIPHGVKHICKYSMAALHSRKIVLPTTLETIDEGAFENAALLEVIIPQKVEFIGQGAFLGCGSLKNVYIESMSISIIEKKLFDGCQTLENILIPESVTHIGDYAFRGCKNLSSICLPANVAEIGINPFIKSGLSKIICKTPNYRFCDGLLIDNDGKKIIAALNTVNCKLNITEGVEFICPQAFANINNLEEVIFPASLHAIGKDAFAGCLSLHTVILEKTSVVELAESVFAGCKKLKKITLPTTLSKISNYALSECDSLEKITLPMGISIIEGRAFYGSGLKCINLSYGMDPKIIPSIQRSTIVKQLSLEDCNLWKDEYGVVFSNDKKKLIEAPSDLEEYCIPEGTEEVCSGAFLKSSKLRRLSFPNTVRKIGNGVFFRCQFKELVLPDSVIEIGNNMFSWCFNMQEFVIPSSVKTIKGNPFGMILFQNHDSVSMCRIKNRSEFFTLINGVLYTKDLKKVVCCTDLTKKSIEIIDTVLEIKEGAFCGSLAESITIPGSVSKIGMRSFSTTKVNTIVIPGTVEVLEEKTFKSCSAKEIILSEGIKEIKDDAFGDCMSLKKIEIPSSVLKIGRWSFAGCHNLQIVMLKGSCTMIDGNAFDYSEKIKKIVVPEGTLDWYKQKQPQFSMLFEENGKNKEQ